MKTNSHNNTFAIIRSLIRLLISIGVLICAICSFANSRKKFSSPIDATLIDECDNVVSYNDAFGEE